MMGESSGYLDTDNASGVVQELLSTMRSTASSLVGQATSAITGLAMGAAITPPTVLLPADVASPDIVSQPSEPGLSVPDMATTKTPQAPDLETFDLPDVSIPDFTATEPTLVYPEEPQLSFPVAPGAAPAIEGVAFPDDPDDSLPQAPQLDTVSLASFSGVSVADFVGERPSAPNVDAVGRVFAYSEGVFGHPMQQAVEEQIYADLAAGGNIDAIVGITEGINEIESVNQRILRLKIDQIRDAFAARGQDDEDGPAQEQIRLAELEYADNVRESASRLVVERCRLTVEHRRFLIERGINYLEILLRAFGESCQRSLEAARLTADFLYRDCESRIALYNLQLAKYQADIALWEASFRAAQQALEARRLELEEARLRGDLRRQDIDVYVAECSALQIKAGIFKARVEAATAKLQGQVENVRAYAEGARAYEAAVNGEVAKVSAYTATIGAQESKIKVFAEQVRAYAEQVAAQKTVADIGMAKADVVAKHNQSTVSLYAAQVEAMRATVQENVAAVDASIRTQGAEVQLYDAKVRGVAARNEAARGKAALDVQIYGQQAQTSLEQARLELSAAIEAARLATESMKASGQIAAQVAASAMAAVHGSASVGFSGNNSNTSSYGVTYSESQTVSEIHTSTESQ